MTFCRDLRTSYISKQCKNLSEKQKFYCKERKYILFFMQQAKQQVRTKEISIRKDKSVTDSVTAEKKRDEKKTDLQKQQLSVNSYTRIIFLVLLAGVESTRCTANAVGSIGVGNGSSDLKLSLNKLQCYTRKVGVDTKISPAISISSRILAGSCLAALDRIQERAMVFEDHIGCD